MTSDRGDDSVKLALGRNQGMTTYTYLDLIRSGLDPDLDRLKLTLSL